MKVINFLKEKTEIEILLIKSDIRKNRENFKFPNKFGMFFLENSSFFFKKKVDIIKIFQLIDFVEFSNLKFVPTKEKQMI